MKNARFEQFGGRFEVVWHNINPMKTSDIVNKLKYDTKPWIKPHIKHNLAFFKSYLSLNIHSKWMLTLHHPVNRCKQKTLEDIPIE